MLEFLKVVFDWSRIVDTGPDAVVFFFMATVGTLLFMIRLALAMFTGGDTDFDSSLDGGDADTSFTFFSLLSILGFFMGAGWMGLACRFDFEMSGPLSAVTSAGFGFAMMILASALTYATRRLNRTIDYDVNTAVGRTGRVYLRIPERGTGHGQVQVTVSGRLKIMRALSTGPAMEAFSDVVVESVDDDGTLVVRPTSDDSPGGAPETSSDN
jgi:hypothetical protein